MKQVAELAGVHASTVSRALNPATRSMVVPSQVARVLKAAKKLGYRLDPVAASLRTGRSNLIGVIVPDLATSVFQPILAGATRRLLAAGFSTLVAYVSSDPDEQVDLVAGLIARRIDGLIVATASNDDPLVAFCLSERLPLVLVNRSERTTRVSAVVSDDLLAMQLSVGHLVELGHRKLGHLAGPSQFSTGSLRRKGFSQALVTHHLDPSDAVIETATAYTREQGAAATRRLLTKDPDITGIVAANDLLALGAYDALRDSNLACPRDISIVGHNDMPLVDLVEPGLTTIRIDHEEMGRQAADLLQQALKEEGGAIRNVVLPPSLVVRGSTAAARRRSGRKITLR